jgi:hypothetical protein
MDSLFKRTAPDAARAPASRWIVSGIILVIFFGALLFDYWPSLAPGVLRMFNSARSVGATTTQSKYFVVRNNSQASDSQLAELVQILEKQYAAISAYTRSKPASRLPVLVVDGSGPAMLDGSQLVISYNSGQMNLDLAPFFLVVMVEQVDVDLSGSITPLGGQALQVVEASGLGDGLIRQPLDDWIVLLRQSKAYLPLDQAWKVPMPNSDSGYYDLMRGVLETGSFMRWFTAEYGLEAAQQVARGQAVENVTGKTLQENEAEWLKSLDQQTIQPKACAEVIPNGSLFSLLCKKMTETAGQ